MAWHGSYNQPYVLRPMYSYSQLRSLLLAGDANQKGLANKHFTPGTTKDPRSQATSSKTSVSLRVNLEDPTVVVKSRPLKI